MKVLFVIAVAIGLVAGSAGAALTESFPRPLGTTYSQVPFGDYYPGELPPYRMQQVYRSSGFLPAMSGGGWITGMWLVSDDEIGRGYTAYLPKVEMLIGLTSRGPDELSPVFAENFAGPPVAVQPLGQLRINSPGRNFYVMFNFVKPFYYEPSLGNLLLEVKNYEPTSSPGERNANPSGFDAEWTIGDSVSRVYSRTIAEAPVGTVDSLGLTTRFVFTRPSLSILRRSTNLVLTWEPSPLVILPERSLSLGLGANWEQVSGSPKTNFSTARVELALPPDLQTSSAFFRLYLPGLSVGGGGGRPAAADTPEQPENDDF